MLTPSWPSPADLRRPVPEPVRRRVRGAERRALRRSVSSGAAVVAALLVADMVVNLLGRTPGAPRLAPFELVAAGIMVAAWLTARRAVIPAEPIGVMALLIVFGVALLGLIVMPEGRVLGVAQLAIILVGTGLFLPWNRRWHGAAMGASVLMAVAFAVGPLAGVISRADRLALLAGVAMAAAVSVIGHGMWQTRLRSMLTQQFELRRLSRYAQRQEAHVTELNRELSQVARRDSLTGIGNRLALDEAIERLLHQGKRLRPLAFALVLFDIDHFKAYNDQYGHVAGDAALGRLGLILSRATRGNDVAFRYGGEEFLLLLPEVSLSEAVTIADRVRAAVAEDSGELPPFTVSGGVAVSDPADGPNPEPLLRRADAALYLAKRAGRNRIAADNLSVAMQGARLEVRAEPG